MNNPPASVASSALVIGTGLIGTSVALGLVEAGVTVYLRDVDPKNVELAASVGAGKAHRDELPELVVVAVPPSAVEAEVRRALSEFDQAVVTDVASVKSSLCASVDDPRFVGGHPMAGKERSGPLAASARLFEGRPWAIVQGQNSAADAVAVVENLALVLGAVPIWLDPSEHDEAVALVSHVPHLVSNLTAGLLTDSSDRQMALSGQGLHDVTRIARSDAGLWIDIIRANSAPILDALQTLRENLDELIEIVGTDSDALESVLAKGRKGTSNIPGKHGQPSGEVTTVYVTIDDEPGELARLFVDTGEAQVNIEDVRIDHEVGRPVGLVEILVLPERAEYLVHALNSRGWSAYL